MAKAIAPSKMPEVPAEAMGWRRSPRRGSIYHAHVMGHPICGSKVYLDRNASLEARNLGDMQYWGVCPHCLAKANA